MEKEIGSIEAGKRADLIAIRIDRAHALPLYGVYSQLVYALKGSDVRDVMVEGKLIVRDGASLTLRAPGILSKAREYGAIVSRSLKN
jgi:5-methylthioadenosine/S-adenosylhomocysteine deaminase